MIDRGRSFQDRNGGNRNQGDDYNENSRQRPQNYNNNRGGFQNRRDQEENGDHGRSGGGRGQHGGKIYEYLYFSFDCFEFRWIC
jgi:hypothetical protein